VQITVDEIGIVDYAACVPATNIHFIFRRLASVAARDYIEDCGRVFCREADGGPCDIEALFRDSEISTDTAMAFGLLGEAQCVYYYRCAWVREAERIDDYAGPETIEQ
jgi:hypothetical protein